MISGKDFYNILSALVPMYFVMILAYGAVKWWKIFTPDQCAGINRFVALFSVPPLLFDFISNNDPYAMNHKFIAADSLQKVFVLLILFIWLMFSKNGSLDWVITLFSIVTLPNTFIIGVPLLEAMYGEYSGKLMVQIVFFQCLVWYNVLLILFEYRGAMILISKKFPGNAGSISSFRVESDVNSLCGHEDVDADAEITDDGKLCVNFRRLFNGGNGGSTSSSSLRHLNASSANVNLHTADDLEQVKEDIFHQTTKKGLGVDIRDTPEMVADVEEGGDKAMNLQMPSVRVLTKLIVVMVWRRMIRIPNTYATVLGLTWSLISFRFGFSMPKIVSKSISVLSATGLGLSMFSLGLFMASQSKVISCGKKIATLTMLARFLVGPAVAAATAAAIGIRGDLLRISIVQAALPSAIVSFVFAKEYNVHADVLSTSISVGMVMALPVTILYYVLMGL